MADRSRRHDRTTAGLDALRGAEAADRWPAVLARAESPPDLPTDDVDPARRRRPLALAAAALAVVAVVGAALVVDDADDEVISTSPAAGAVPVGDGCPFPTGGWFAYAPNVPGDFVSYDSGASEPPLQDPAYGGLAMHGEVDGAAIDVRVGPLPTGAPEGLGPDAPVAMLDGDVATAVGFLGLAAPCEAVVVAVAGGADAATDAELAQRQASILVARYANAGVDADETTVDDVLDPVPPDGDPCLGQRLRSVSLPEGVTEVSVLDGDEGGGDEVARFTTAGGAEVVVRAGTGATLADEEYRPGGGEGSARVGTVDGAGAALVTLPLTAGTCELLVTSAAASIDELAAIAEGLYVADEDGRPLLDGGALWPEIDQRQVPDALDLAAGSRTDAELTVANFAAEVLGWDDLSVTQVPGVASLYRVDNPSVGYAVQVEAVPVLGGRWYGVRTVAPATGGSLQWEFGDDTGVVDLDAAPAGTDTVAITVDAGRESAESDELGAPFPLGFAGADVRTVLVRFLDDDGATVAAFGGPVPSEFAGQGVGGFIVLPIPTG